MALLVYDCPFCGTEKMSSVITSFDAVPYDLIAPSNLRPFAIAHTVCGNCWNPVGAKLTRKDSQNASLQAHFNQKLTQAMGAPYSVGPLGFEIEIVRTPPPVADIPPHLSETVAKAFRSAERNMSLPDGEDASATMYRRAIDVAIREKFPKLPGMLAKRIEAITKQGLLPQQMKDWADHIRWIGNDGAHDPEGVNREELVVLRGFTDAFLRYFISLPFEVALRRGEINEDGSPKEALAGEVNETAG